MPIQAQGQQYVFNRSSYAVGITGGNLGSIASGDFNGDGLLDLVEANLESRSISVLLANPDGTFQPHVDFATGTFPASLAVGDFNRDGKLDVAVAIGNSTTVTIFLGKGDGTFRAPEDFQAGTSNPSIVKVTDLNGDGKLDLVVSHNNSNEVSVLLGKGNGTFPKHVDYPTGSNPVGVAIGDFNGDGKLDVAVACVNSQGVGILLGNGDGTLKSQTLVPVSPSPLDVVAADLNQDLKTDLIAGGVVLLGNGDGTFHALAPNSFGGGQLAVGDVNGDGKLDVVATVGGITVALGVGDGTFQAPQSYASTGSAGSLTLADFNRDGALDVATADSYGNNGGFVTVFVGNGDGTFMTRNLIAGTFANPIGIAVADVNGDGKLDLALVDNALTAVLVQLGNGDGTFQPAVDYSTGPSPNAVVIADFNKDHHPDIVTPNYAGSSISILLGNGDGTFGGHTDFPTAQAPLSVAVADFNGDGKLDVAVAVSSGVSVLIGRGDGTFKKNVDYAAGSGAYGITTGDFDHDGKIDLAVTNLNGNTISILRGNGDGTFQSHQDFASVFEPEQVTVGDFNADGNLDLAITEHLFSVVSVMLGTGDGTFPSHVEYPAGFSPFSIVAADINGDGRIDLATADYGNGNAAAVSIFPGNGDGTFQNHLDFSDGGFAGFALAAGDLDGNGSVDLVVTNRNGPGTSVLLNTPVIAIAPTAVNFPTQTIGTTSQPQAITISNPGSAQLGLNSISVAGTNAGDFLSSTTCGQSLPLGQSCTVSVGFAPQGKGGRRAFVDVKDGAPTKQQQVRMAGTGTVVLIAPVGLNFGDQNVGTVSAPQTITLTNKGSGRLKINKVGIAGSGKADFAIQQNSCAGNLDTGGSCQIGIVFQPMKAGNRAASLNISDNGGASPQKVGLIGAGQ